MDAIAHNNTYVKSALFCYANTPFFERSDEISAKKSLRRGSKTGNEGAAFLRNTYSVDIGSSETERVQLEVRNPTSFFSVDSLPSLCKNEFL